MSKYLSSIKKRTLTNLKIPFFILIIILKETIYIKPLYKQFSQKPLYKSISIK